MNSYFRHSDLTRLLFAHNQLKRQIARILENTNSQREISKLRLEIDKQVLSFLQSLTWTRESTLWKAAIRMIKNPIVHVTKEPSNEFYQILLLSAICTRLMFSEINTIIATRRLHEV